MIILKNKNLIITILIAIIVGGTGFFAGMKYQQGKMRTFGRNFPGVRDGAGIVRNQGFRPVSGEIIEVDEKSITVKLADGSSKIVLINDSTQINQAATASKEDLKVGVKAAAFGQANSDGSISAQTVQLNPQQLRVGNPNQ